MKRFAFAVILAGCGPIGSSGSSDTGVVADGDPIDTGIAVDTGPVDTGPPTPQPTAKGGYYVSGNKIYDEASKPHMFHGLDRPSTEWNWKGEHLAEADFAKMASWKANVVRIPLNQGFWLAGGTSSASGYEATIDQSVKWARAAGMDVILDLHWTDKGNPSATAGQQKMADKRSIDLWKAVATKYKDDGKVMFELYNEPHDVSWEVWQNGGASGEGWDAVGMQALYDAVRGVGANNLVFIGGLRYAFDLSGVPTHRIKGFNIVYVTHPYAYSDKQPPTWDAAFGFLTATDPVMATEFGDITGACGPSYTDQLIAYADAHGMSWSSWAWWVASCKFPSLIVDWNGTPSEVGLPSVASPEPALTSSESEWPW